MTNFFSYLAYPIFFPAQAPNLSLAPQPKAFTPISPLLSTVGKSHHLVVCCLTVTYTGLKPP